MLTSRDWLPRTRTGRIQMAQLWVEQLTMAGIFVYGVTQQEFAALSNLTTTAAASNRAAQEGFGNRLLIAQAKDDEKKLVALMRQLHRRFRSMNLSNTNIVAMGLNPHDTTRTDHTIVRELVEFVLRIEDAILQVFVDFWVQGADHRAKPVGYDGAVVIYAVLDAPPTSYDALVNHEMASRTPHILHFDLSERGKTVYVALCWQNERGIRGAWSEIKEYVIP